MSQPQVIKVTPNDKGEIIIRLYGTDYLIDVQKPAKKSGEKKTAKTEE